MNDKKWAVATTGLLCIALLAIAGITVVIDPFFHYHKPLKMLQYHDYEQRYTNDGISKHFDYDAIITGTSMTENFKATEFDRLWNASAIKIPYSGASYKEINDSLTRALEVKPQTKYILRALDTGMLIADKDSMRYEHSFYPWYLYDKNVFNDVNYVFNKDVLINKDLETLSYTRGGGKMLTFDEYSNWNSIYKPGKASVLKDYTRPEISDEDVPFSDEDRKMESDNLEQNVTELAEAYPETKFYLFFPPYSIAYWDSMYRSGNLQRQIEAEKTAIEKLLQQENIELYSFSNNFELTCDLDNYKDSVHYSEKINSQILKWIHNGEYRLTQKNYLDYLDDLSEYYGSYDYDSIFE